MKYKVTVYKDNKFIKTLELTPSPFLGNHPSKSEVDYDLMYQATETLAFPGQTTGLYFCIDEVK